ncbi:DNA gyrase inhibitor YacG [Schlesneria sp. DSM 10557]|uniref:DNA gyrase inhibitor YacG n=1 Tax=Schlesneria sp. DSM 10557 TaxID=3044399 RepID=UPI00359F8A77
MIRLPECPICQKAVAPATDPASNYAPFCSRRCKEVDLIRWCEGRYAIVEKLDPARQLEELASGQDAELEDELLTDE